MQLMPGTKNEILSPSPSVSTVCLRNVCAQDLTIRVLYVSKGVKGDDARRDTTLLLSPLISFFFALDICVNELEDFLSQFPETHNSASPCLIFTKLVSFVNEGHSIQNLLQIL